MRRGDSSGIGCDATVFIKKRVFLDTSSGAACRGHLQTWLMFTTIMVRPWRPRVWKKLHHPYFESRPEPEILPVKLSTAIVSVPPGSFAVEVRLVLEDVLSLECLKTDWTAD
jgi:hypothetical protein